MARSLKRRRPVERDAAWIPSAVGFAISAYLLVLDRFNAAAFCVTRYACEIVRSSAYGRILGIPVAAVGVVFFAAAFGLSSTRTAWRSRVLEILAAAGAGGAVVFVGLQVAVIHAVCPSCLAAEAAAFALAYLVLKNSPRTHWIDAGVAAVLAAAVLSIIYVGTPTRPAGSAYTTGLARHLAASGAVMYGAYWCPHCREQKALFGPAASLLPYVECDPRDEHSQYERCRVRGIRAFPTWEFHGQLVEGALSLEELARRSGYPPPP
ncbi:MAG: hypothetical protein E6H03_02905 [Bacillati bacterium ANGP1]|uniref:Vitamin K epoxide reductase domain-containing protein n=1 Tax=Candidatus Segetimicrobium genomatis TaxID=2569760 RepID=A0A537JK94_9BACT|nr:MAG: hypothetical protein E6H03_02905 [Terrabacteria group bacterium ANGP1]